VNLRVGRRSLRDLDGALLELIAVPWDVDRADTPAARAPAALLAHGFIDSLRERGARASARILEEPPPATRHEMVVSIERQLAQRVREARRGGRLPVILSGGCLHALGVVAGLGAPIEIVWIDAHGDLNTPTTSVSGYWDGMALAALCGHGLDEIAAEIGLQPVSFDDVVHVAGRAFDRSEIEFMSHQGLRIVGPDLAAEAEGTAPRANTRALYLHVDLDGIDPGDAPAVSFPVVGGPRLDHLLAWLAPRLAGGVSALTLSALAFDGRSAEETERTLEACVEIVGVACRAINA
jgi:arginase